MNTDINFRHSAIVHTAVDDLVPYQGNARTHSRRQIAQIADSIKRFGFLNPVLIDGSNQIIAGHGRIAAAKKLGLTSVPTLRIEHLSDDERRAYVLADNRLAEKAGWDRELLAIELQHLVEIEFDTTIIGFETAEVDIILNEAKDARGEPSRPDRLWMYELSLVVGFVIPVTRVRCRLTRLALTPALEEQELSLPA